MFAELAQKRVQGGCGRLWKTVKNVTAKSLAQTQPRTHIEATSARTRYRRCQRVEDAEKDAIGHRGNGFYANASSQMSTRGGRSRWRDGPSGQRNLHGCFIADVNVQETRSKRRDESRRRRGRHERFIADVNVHGFGCDGAMSHRDGGLDTNASSQMSTCRSRGRGDAMSHRDDEVGVNASSRMSTR